MILNLSQLREDYKAVYKIDFDVAKKLEVLIEITKIELSYQEKSSQAGKRIKFTEVLNAVNIRLRTLQRWKKYYREQGPYGLLLKERGHSLRKVLSSKAKGRIANYRSTFRWGSETIQAHLLRDDSITLNRYQIDRYLKESGLKDKYPCTTKKKTKHKIKKKKHTKKVVVHAPGKHTQMDIKYQTQLLENKSKAYVYNFIDHASNWSFKYAYERISTANTKDFMTKVLEECPFNIERIQTDNGVEFTFRWISEFSDDPKIHPLMKLCHEEKIIHKLIPPGEKELQGLVERSHRQDDQELFSRIEPRDLSEFNDLLEGYYKFRNRGRRFKKLGWKSPDMWLEDYLIRYLAIALHIQDNEKTVEKLVA